MAKNDTDNPNATYSFQSREAAHTGDYGLRVAVYNTSSQPWHVALSVSSGACGLAGWPWG